MARPIPCAPPVMTARRPARSIRFISLRHSLVGFSGDLGAPASHQEIQISPKVGLQYMLDVSLLITARHFEHGWFPFRASPLEFLVPHLALLAPSFHV